MAGFSIKIKESSKENLTAREKLILTDTSKAISLDKALFEDSELIIHPVDYAILDVHNEKSQDRKDYENYLITADDGETYVTGSSSFWSAFKGIYDIMKDDESEKDTYQIKIYKMASKNYPGKDFITCSII